MAISQKPKSIGVIFMLVVLLFSYGIARALWIFPSTIPPIKESWQNSQAYRDTPTTDTRFNDALDLTVTVDKCILALLAIYVLALIIFFGLSFANRNKPEHFITHLMTAHKGKVRVSIVIATLLFVGMTVWIYTHPLAVQNSIILDNLATLRRG